MSQRGGLDQFISWDVIKKTNDESTKKPLDGEIRNRLMKLKDMKYTSLLKASQVTIFSASWCPYSKKAKKLLDLLKIPYKAYETDLGEVDQDLIKQLQISTGRKTWPNIFIGTTNVGGFDELSKYNDNKYLQTLLDDNNIQKSFP